MTGDDGGRLGAMKVMVLQIVAGLVSALLSISRLTLTGQRFGKLKLSRAFRAGRPRITRLRTPATSLEPRRRLTPDSTNY